MESIGTEYVDREGSPRIAGTISTLFRLSKPGIVSAVILAGFTGMVMAQRGWPDGGTGFICLAALLLSAAGSAIINGVLDAPLDRHMERLSKRSAALEDVGRGRALAVAIAAIITALFVSFRFLGALEFLLILAAVLSYTLLYTLRLKRRSPWGAVPGGIPGALPVLIGFAAVAGTLRLDAIILFVFMLLWQPPHFWTLAMGYYKDYRNAGLHVLPVIKGKGFTRLLIFIYAASLIPASLCLVLFGFCSVWFGWMALFSGIAFLVACQLFLIREKQILMAFKASILYLLAIFAAIVIDICYVQGHLS